MGRKDLRRIDAHWHSNGGKMFRAVSASGTGIACETDENELRASDGLPGAVRTFLAQGLEGMVNPYPASILLEAVSIPSQSSRPRSAIQRWVSCEGSEIVFHHELLAISTRC